MRNFYFVLQVLEWVKFIKFMYVRTSIIFKYSETKTLHSEVNSLRKCSIF